MLRGLTSRRWASSRPLQSRGGWLVWAWRSGGVPGAAGRGWSCRGCVQGDIDRGDSGGEPGAAAVVLQGPGKSVMRSGAAVASVGAGNLVHIMRPGDIRWSARQGASPFSDAVLVEIDRLGQRLHRRGCVQGAVRPVLIVVGLVLAQE